MRTCPVCGQAPDGPVASCPFCGWTPAGPWDPCAEDLSRALILHGWRRNPAPPGGRPRAVDPEDVLLALIEHGPMSSADMSERLGVSPATVWRRLSDLRAEGLVQLREGLWEAV